ncbi:serine/threonine-protein kinase [Nonomuraea endophytica]|uniref:Serine/threonine protein kinase n=1 Tax=Nonomuraea endophytica TaxID=714136 RepID=A0A7W8ED76_9ACTN|nr:serine/threonine-protein kinase [Nonomuraea endophytica]MBB5076285.1 serine/threonine protein kinase [Nonomuraea endophytica]
MSGETSHIGRYKLISVLGRGGMGTVHLAEDPAGVRVAVKVINPEFSQHEQFRMRFRREADAAQRVRRFCTAAVLDAALDGNQLYVVTEYVPGPNLEEAVKQSGPLTGSSLDALAVSVATALTAIHGAGVVHRDLKPSNVLLSPVGPRVIDFGIARALDELGGVTGTGEIIGTPRYMAPEVLRGEPVSPACDVFSWGCLIAFAASGRAPFGGDSLPSMIYSVLSTEPDLGGVEPALRPLVVAALQKDPALRPTAQQLLDHLVGRQAAPEQAAHTVQVAWQRATTPLTTAQPAPPGGGGRRAKLIAGVTGGAVLVTGGVVAALLLSQSSPPTHLGRLYQEDFTTSSGGWDGTYDADDEASYGYKTDGTYGLDVEPSYEQRWAKAPAPFANASPTPSPSATPTPLMPDSVLVSVTAQASKVSGDGEYGVYCHNTADGTFYEFGLDTTGNARIRKIIDGAGGTLAQQAKLEIKPRAKVRLEAFCEQSGSTVKLTMWVDGKQVLRAEDPNGIKTGHVGLFARVPKDEQSIMKTVFDDFELRGQRSEQP